MTTGLGDESVLTSRTHFWGELLALVSASTEWSEHNFGAKRNECAFALALAFMIDVPRRVALESRKTEASAMT